MQYRQLVRELAPLEEVPREVFVGSTSTPQNVCDLVLALALVYNDFRDIASAHLLLEEVRPKSPARVSREAGHFGGLFISVLRLQAGVIHELINLVRKNRSAAEHPSFTDFVSGLGTRTAEAWSAITGVAFDEPRADPLGSALLLLRNNVSFHYGPKAIRQGLQSYLAGGEDRALFISRGNALRHARFYFADAAAEAALIEQAETPAVREFLEFKGPLIKEVNWALYTIVSEFVGYRGYAYRGYQTSA